MDVYVATSMRTDADFVSVNDFAETLFQQEDIRPLKLRYFNPTQSWIEDRIAKGLVEALMLRRASITIYMAQKGDTFGKDSEASVALGQGKPVIVYVPKLVVQGDLPTDTEILMRSDRNQLVATVRSELEGEEAEVDETIDNQALVSRILVSRLQKTPDQYLVDAVGRHWADFDLYGESERIKDENKTTEESKRSQYRTWLDKVTKGTLAVPTIPDEVRADLIRILVAIAIRFEDRAKLFREIHPLALQVILSSGVLNGILVVRSVEQCSQVLRALIENKLDLDLKQDDMNYRLVERSTGSTIRVISRHKLLRNAFETYYSLRKRP